MIEWGNNWARAISHRQNNNEAFAGFFSQVGRLYNVHHFWCEYFALPVGTDKCEARRAFGSFVITKNSSSLLHLARSRGLFTSTPRARRAQKSEARTRGPPFQNRPCLAARADMPPRLAGHPLGGLL